MRSPPDHAGDAGTVAWISSAPVKGLRMAAHASAELTAAGIPGDRGFFLVDAGGTMVSATRLGALLAVVAEYERDAGVLTLSFPGGGRTDAPVELGDPETVSFNREPRRARPVRGPFSAALSRHAGVPLRLFATPPEWSGLDRRRGGVVTLLSLGSLERLREVAGVAEPVDHRRFRMTIGLEGLPPHGEDGWIGETIRIGSALVKVGGHVGRCAATTRNPDSGVVDFRTLHHLAAYRATVPAQERLPFGVFAAVVEPGSVALGDPAALATPRQVI